MDFPVGYIFLIAVSIYSIYDGRMMFKKQKAIRYRGRTFQRSLKIVEHGINAQIIGILSLLMGSIIFIIAVILWISKTPFFIAFILWLAIFIAFNFAENSILHILKRRDGVD